MSDVKPWIRVECFAEFPEDDAAGDKALDDLCDAVEQALEAASIPRVYAGSWSVDDADAPSEARYEETDDDRETEQRERHRKGLQGSLSDSDGIEPW